MCPSDKPLDRLPKWAQAHIADLERRLATALRATHAAYNDQTPSPFWSEDHLCLQPSGSKIGPTTHRRYFQAYTLTVQHGGMILNITPTDRGDRPAIDLQWGSGDRWPSGEVLFLPTSYMAASLRMPKPPKE